MKNYRKTLSTKASLVAGAGLAFTLLASGVSQADGHGELKSPYSDGDMAGASNLMTSEKVLEAMKLMTTGTVVSIGRTYEREMPLFGARAFAVRGTGGLAGGPLGENKVIWMDDFLATEIGQVGTQFDGLAHIGIGDNNKLFYGGVPAEEVIGPYGVKKLGIEHVKPFFTRGVLVDMVALKGRAMEAGEEITADDIKAALDKQGIPAPGKGDVAVSYTHLTLPTKRIV